MAQDFLGSGMKFPPKINPATGRFEVAAGETSVKESVYLILMTQKTERWIRPDFGSSLMNYTFMNTNTTVLNMMAREIAGDLMRQEPRISDVEVKIDAKSKPGCLIIYIGYRIRETNVIDNLVFPFYLNTTWEEEEPQTEPVFAEE
ncbi:MAG: GPW/gp25 family protein [Anaerotignum sp.]|nr:GPW/gp25 family protein [Anaerotignum sp.]